MIKFLLLFLPSKLKISIYRLLGAKIGKNSYIGFSIISADKIEIGECVYIGHFNLIWRLKNLELKSGSRIGQFNWVTGASSGSLTIGNNSAVTRFHFLESSADIIMGNNSIIAGRSSHFITHGLTPTSREDLRSIHISDWCYIGSSVRFVPGVFISDHSFVGMGAVVTKRFNEPYVLIAGNPAQVKKKLTKNDAYFSRDYLDHEHHSP